MSADLHWAVAARVADSAQQCTPNRRAIVDALWGTRADPRCDLSAQRRVSGGRVQPT